MSELPRTLAALMPPEPPALACLGVEVRDCETAVLGRWRVEVGGEGRAGGIAVAGEKEEEGQMGGYCGRMDAVRRIGEEEM